MRKLLIAGMAALLAGCAAPYHDNGQAVRDAYEARQEAIWARAEAKDISYVVAAQQQVHVAHDVYPDDYQLHALREYKVLLADRFERGTITRAEFDAAWGERINTLLAERAAQYQAQQAANNRMADALTIQQIGRMTDRMRPAPAVSCTSTNSFGVVTTNCR